MGVFDLASPFLSRADGWMGALPPAARLVVWSVVGAVVSMGLYWLLSPQRKIEDLKLRLKQAQAALDSHEGELKEAFPLMRSTLSLALRQVFVILVPAVVASLPLLFLLAFVYSAYAYRFPAPGETVAARAAPAQFQARWASPPPRVAVTGPGGDTVAEVALKAPVASLYTRQWWNAFFANPAGYLPEDGPVRIVSIEMPARTYFPFGPSWLRGWEATFFAVLVVVSVLIKVVFRIR